MDELQEKIGTQVIAGLLMSQGIEQFLKLVEEIATALHEKYEINDDLTVLYYSYEDLAFDLKRLRHRI